MALIPCSRARSGVGDGEGELDLGTGGGKAGWEGLYRAEGILSDVEVEGSG
jgi:hypothetical protein